MLLCADTVRMLSKHGRCLPNFCVDKILVFQKMLCFYENKSIQHQTEATFRVKFLAGRNFAEFFSLIEDLKTIKFLKYIFNELSNFTYFFLKDREFVS